MKKSIIYCLAIVGLSFGRVYSQKIDLDKEQWAHSYVSLPRLSDLSNLNTYSITMFANSDNLTRIGLSSNKIEATLKLDGFVYTTGLADILVDVTIENLRKISEEVKAQESTVYEGGKNVVKKTFTPTTSYAIPTTIKITKSLTKEQLINRSIGFDQDPIVITTGTYASYDAANASFKENGDKRLESCKEKYFALLTTVLTNFREKYDFIVTQESDIFWHVDLKKNPEFAEFNEKLTAAKGIFADQKASDDIKTTREKLAPTLQYLRENADKQTTEDKKGKKLKYAYLLNLGRTQLWLEMFDECAVTAQQVIDNDYDKSDGKTLLRVANGLKEELKKSPNGSRHMMREGFTSTARFSASEIKPVPFKFPNPPAGFTSYQGTMTTITGEKYKGELWANALGVLNFEPRADTRFVYEKNNELKEQSINVNEIQEIALNSGEKFVRLKYKSSNMFFQILHESANFKILKYFRANEEEGIEISQLNNGSEVCIMKKASGDIKSVGARFAGPAAKRTAEFYAGCQALQTKILADEFGKMNELDGQVKALTFFESNCK